ncbi:MAG: flagellar hook-length control protein FliK [Desulfobacterales bacterium]|nr:flagellar hook-length control protein FliK [Desulfobacterales bacterium]
MPLNVKSSMDRIIDRSVAANEKLELQLAVPSILQLKSAQESSAGVKNDELVKNSFSLPWQEGIKGRGIFAVSSGNRKINETGHDAEVNRMAAQVNKDGKQSIKKDNYGARIIEAGRQEKSDRIADLNEGSGYKKEMNPETDRGGLKTKATEILQDAGYPSVRYETFSSILRNRQTDSNFFPEHIVDQLGKQISRSVVKGDRIINLQLNPPELGAVKLSMEIKGNTLQLGMIAESSSVKEVLLANAHELKAALLDQGIKLDSLDIQVEQGFGRSLTNLNEGLEREHQRHQKMNEDLISDNDFQEDILPNLRSMAGRDYLLDLKA